MYIVTTVNKDHTYYINGPPRELWTGTLIGKYNNLEDASKVFIEKSLKNLICSDRANGNVYLLSNVYMFEIPVDNVYSIENLVYSLCKRCRLLINCTTGGITASGQIFDTADNLLVPSSILFAKELENKLISYCKLNQRVTRWYRSDNYYYKDILNIIYNELKVHISKV
jgi:hypothetical protein